MKLPVLKIFTYLILFIIPLLSPAQDDILYKKVYGIEKGTLPDILRNIEAQLPIRFNYKNQDINTTKVYFISDSSSVKSILDNILPTQSITYNYLGNGIVVLKKIVAKQTISISGYISDIESFNGLPSALIMDLSTGKYCYSNDEGHFNIHLPYDTTTLAFMFSGYEPFFHQVSKPKDKVISVFLKPGKLLQETVILAQRDSNFFYQHYHYSMLNDEVHKKLPSLLGHGDPFNNISLLPGIQSLRDVSPGILVRGGGPDQNLILIDGVPIYNPTHLFGLISVVDADIMQSFKIYKDAFPAYYGGKLSSVMDIKTRNGSVTKYKTRVHTGMLASGFVVEGPILKEKSSLLISARRSYTDLAIKGLNKFSDVLSGSNTEPGYYFYDINVKYMQRFNSHSHLQAAIYSGSDRGRISSQIKLNDSTGLEENTSVRMRWGTNNAIIRWSYTPHSRLLNNLSVYATQYELKFGDYYQSKRTINQKESKTTYNLDYFSGIRDFGLKNETEFNLNEQNKIRAGVNIINHQFNPGSNRYVFESSDKISIDTTNGIPSISSWEANIYLHHSFKYKKRLSLESGIHQAIYLINGKIFYGFQPRIASEVMLTKKIMWLSDFSRMVQFIHLLPNNNLGLPFDIWLPVTGKLSPFTSFQISTGFKMKWRNWEYLTDLYSKKQKSILEFRDGANLILASADWEKELVAGQGNIAGWEQMLKFSNKKITSWLSYSLCKSYRQFELINGGESFPYKYDRRHQLTFAFSWKLNENWNCSADWVYMSGNPVTVPEDRFLLDLEGTGYPIELLGKRNNFRMPAYHRLDISFNKTKLKKWGETTWNFGVYNLYNHQNPYYLYFGYNNQGEITLKQRSLLPVIPSISFAATIK